MNITRENVFDFIKSIDIDKKIFLIINCHIIEKISAYNGEIKYILKQSKDKFEFTAPEVVDNYFLPIVVKCLLLEKNEVPVEDWLNELDQYLL